MKAVLLVIIMACLIIQDKHQATYWPKKKGTEILTGLAWVILMGTDLNILRSERGTWISSPANIQWDCAVVHHSKKTQQV